MKHTKRILSILIAALLAFGIAIPSAYAAPDNDTLIFSVGGDTGIFEIYNGQEWKALTVPFWMEAGDGSWAFCLESHKEQPMGDNYSMSSALYSANVLRGVRAILLYGFPNVLGGLTETQAHYATQAAIWTWMYEAAGVGYQSYAEENLRPTSGNQAVYSYYQKLMDYARRGVDTVNYSARLNPNPVILRPNGSGRLVGTTTMEFLENVDSYSIDQRNLPALTTIDGNTYRNGDTVTVTAPLEYAGSTFTTHDIFHLSSTRTPANIFWYEPGGGDLQNMVVYDMSFQPAAAIPLTIICEDIKQGRIIIQKTNANPSMGNYSLAGAEFDIFTGTREFMETITTNADGFVQSKMLDLGNYIVVEKKAPNGYVRHNTEYGVRLETVNPNLGYAVTNVDVPQQPQVGIIRVNKTNANPANGDYSLRGAIFEVRNSAGTLVDTITTGDDGRAQSKQLPLGNYVVTEKTAPTGFLRDTNEYPANLVYGDQNVEVVYADVNVPEQPQMGRINIKKTNATPAMGDYSLAGAIFEIFDGSTLVDTVTTNAQGEAQSKTLKLGSYTVKEKTAPYGYVLNTNSFTANLTYAGQDVELAIAAVTVPQQPQTGIIRLAKTNANPSMGDYSLAGAVFEVRNSAGTLVDTITTNASGLANSKELSLGSYTVTEKTAPHGFVRNRNTFSAQLTYAGQTVSVVYTDVVVAEQPQVGKITVTKRDKTSTDRAQGDAVLTGAVFEVYASDKTTLVDAIYTGSGTTATTKELPLGTYYVREKTPPVGYTLSEDFHQVKLEYAGQEIEVTGSSYDLKNKVVEGQIAIVKHLDEAMEGYDDPQIQQPLENAIFEIYLTAAGSYDKARETERDRLTTNENGWALSKKLPYGMYTIHEVEAPGDLKLVAPFQVFISEEGKIYYFILENLQFRSLVQIVKKDATTGNVIPVAGTTFRIRELSSGEWVTQRVTYPTPMDISEFVTAPDGKLVLPEPLKSGDYELVEVTAPRGYLLSDKAVKFTIHSSMAEGECVTVTMENQPVMGKISVEKQGNMLVGAKEIETIFGPQFLPIFELGYLVGAEFDVVAATDIVTPDGTVRAKKGDVVDKIVTGDKGQATSKELFLGDYALVETKAPPNYVLDPTPHPVALVYENQTIAVVTSQIGIMNARQLVEIELLKRMEGFDKFDRFEDVIFGLFAAEDIYAEDGTLIIAKDSLIIVQDSLVSLAALDKDGRGRFEGELPFAKYYVMELQTAEGFVLDKTKYPVDASYTGEGNAVTRIKVNGGEAIVNKRALGELRILKLDAKTHKPLQGAKFGLFQGDKKIGEGVSDAKGYVQFNDLPFGEYQVKELEAPDGYVLVEEIWTINVRENGQKILLEVLNQKEPGEPDEPDQPDEPDEPEIPDEPDEPEVPDEPDEPETPDEPGKPKEPDEPGKPVPPWAPLPKTGDSRTIVTVALIVLIIAGGVVLWLRKRGKAEEEPTNEENV